jgi:hypothetical protein
MPFDDCPRHRTAVGPLINATNPQPLQPRSACAPLCFAMPIYRLTSDAIQPLSATSFAERGVKERGDLQRVLRDNISVIADDLLVISEEFSEWEDSRRRIDLLCIDRSGVLVIVELKRDDDGGHMDLQAIRYAAMVSSMTFARATDAFQAYLDRRQPGQDARRLLMEFLGWEEAREDEFGQDVRIILVAADFSKELTTSVLWLNEREIDIRCVRMKPYASGSDTIMDVQQIIPLLEAEEYTIQLKHKEQLKRIDHAARLSDRRAFWMAVLPAVQQATGKWRNWNPAESHWIGTPSGSRGLTFYLWVRQNDCGCQLNIDGGHESQSWNKDLFDGFVAKRADIEAAFGRPLDWHRLDDKRSSIISTTACAIGHRASRDAWSAASASLAETAAGFLSALLPHIATAIAAASRER